MSINVTRFCTGPLETNAYCVDDGTHCFIVDPSAGCSAVLNHIADHALTPEAIILTHGHFDHILGIDEIRDAFGIDVYVHPSDSVMLRQAEANLSTMMGFSYQYDGPISILSEGEMQIGSFLMKVLHVPGHSPGSCALVLDNQCISGDCLFAGSIGRTDFPGGDMDMLLGSIRDKLLVLPDETVIHSGHGGRTTIGREKRMNPFIQHP